MSELNPRSATQLRLLTTSRCLYDLINLDRTNNRIICNRCFSDNNSGFYDSIRRHRASIGDNPCIEYCSICTRPLSVVRPAYYCPTCFGLIIDFLSSRTNTELELIETNQEPSVIVIEQRVSYRPRQDPPAKTKRARGAFRSSSWTVTIHPRIILNLFYSFYCIKYSINYKLFPHQSRNLNPVRDR